VSDWTDCRWRSSSRRHGSASWRRRRSSRTSRRGWARSAPAGLSARELEVVGLAADGLANKTIASELHLSVRTVESHVRHVLAKAGLQKRTQLATWAREHIQ
jgi:DNA-binding NarL/FixJ family response regulator